MENPIKIDDLGVPLFLETPISRELLGGHIPAKLLFIPRYVTVSCSFEVKQNCLLFWAIANRLTVHIL